MYFRNLFENRASQGPSKEGIQGNVGITDTPGPRISILRIRCCDRRIKGYRKLRQNKTNKFVYSALIFTTFVKRHEKNHR